MDIKKLIRSKKEIIDFNIDLLSGKEFDFPGELKLKLANAADDAIPYILNDNILIMIKELRAVKKLLEKSK